ncbi:uncharacterized protein MONBRDRAFT_26234 [Monosiga brevicollis MX1]|uniref:Protein kinase domain-containing protein n=1 Tax=Monosiga brevicollis TaxID=81824 RepID=A9V1S3_MONBE|nr:uncharacterized protein MONBRDRAFT_26234 [Monosiga brevicollis MX1]EDQ88613.1 predicted protein [Monosiga brevicollis MX1]|eukprot:XP_001746717.1 hypothetical protein [Monosiga brevicollis MX1]
MHAGVLAVSSAAVGIGVWCGWLGHQGRRTLPIQTFVICDQPRQSIAVEELTCQREECTSDAYSMAAPLPQPQALRFEDITLDTCIGAGGFGRVYRGHLRLNETDLVVAIKELTVPRVADFESKVLTHRPTILSLAPLCLMMRDFRQEAELLYGCSHRNIASLYGQAIRTKREQLLDYHQKPFLNTALDADSTPARAPNYYLVLEYCAGGSLGAVLRTHTLEPEVIIDWASQIAQGMRYLHDECRQCIVHRDLKSENILLSKVLDNGQPDLSRNVVKLCDFGTARAFAETVEMTQAGTFAYMAPEVIKTSRFGKESDCWSWGVVLWELMHSELDELRTSQFARNEHDAFFDLQQAWRDECHEKFKQLHRTEEEIAQQHHALRHLQAEQRIQQEALNKREAVLSKRECALLEREMAIISAESHNDAAAGNVRRRQKQGRRNKRIVGLSKDEISRPSVSAWAYMLHVNANRVSPTSLFSRSFNMCNTLVSKTPQSTKPAPSCQKV